MQTWNRRGARALLLVTLALALAAVSCSGEDAAMDVAEEVDAGAPAEAPVADEDREVPAGEAGDAATPASPLLGRRVIRTAHLVLEVDDATAAADEVVAIAERAGGFVATTDLSRDAQGLVTGTIVIRVPSEQLLATVDALDALAVSVPVSRIDETDVTAEATDLEAQRTNLVAYERELRSLLADVRETSDRADDLLTVFERIRSVREEIDRIDARLSVLEDQVALSTITVTLRPAARALPLSDPTWQPGDTVREALAGTTRALTTIADALIWTGLALVPVLLVLALPVVVLVLVVRWLRRRRGTPG